MCSACLLNLMKNCSHIILTSVCVMQYFVTYLLCAHHASFMTVLCTPFGLGVIYFQDETYLHRYFTAFTETLCYCSIQVFTCVANCCCDFSKCNATKHALIQAVCSCLWVESMELCAVFMSSVYVTACGVCEFCLCSCVQWWRGGGDCVVFQPAKQHRQVSHACLASRSECKGLVMSVCPVRADFQWLYFGIQSSILNGQP